MNKWGARLILFPLVPVLRLERYALDQGGGFRSKPSGTISHGYSRRPEPSTNEVPLHPITVLQKARYWETCTHHIRQKEEGRKSWLSFARKPVIQVTVRMAIGHILNPSDLLLQHHPLSSKCLKTLRKKKVTY